MAGAPSLKGLRVLDLSRVLAGPLCGQMLSDHGAEVIKVESPTGDETRMLGPPFDSQGAAAYFGSVNRGKRSISLDLTQEQGREVLHRLIAGSDVLIENFMAGTMERWGLSYETVLAEKYPSLIYCQISGFGSDGPLGGLPGYDAVLQAMCGLMSINGTPDSGTTRLGVPVVDHLTAYTSLVGILMALHVRSTTGRGQKVETALFDSALSLLVPHAANWLWSGKTPGLMGSAHPNISPYDKYSAADGEVFLGLLTDGQFRKFCQFVGRPELATDARFASNAQRVQHRDELREQIDTALAGRQREELCEALMQIGVPAGPVNTVEQALSQPHAKHRRMVLEGKNYRGLGPTVNLSATPPSPRPGIPALSGDADEVLAEIGMSQEEIAQLRAAGVLMARSTH